ncbi:hypothetical protein [Paenibacillus tepidiphilus]|uniref:hypothetical protein n=1 Tax=Paenibacillus tepidiphilus TaxID=2608683 RepID=UPI00123986C3|nr:hypothetical protein [Paenibacillus tepidiphilus]
MKRWKKILIWTLSVLVVLGVGGLFAANYAVDKLMNSMASSFDVEETVADDTVSDEVAEPAVVSEDQTAEPTETAVPTQTVSPGSGSSEESSKAATATDKPDPVSTTKPASPTSSATDNKGSSSSGYTAQVSTDKAKEIQENVTVKDKADVASIVLGQLSMSDIKRLQELASGGLTIEEKREARSIILGKVSEEQYNDLSQIAKKYGVSQGKSRDQILEEEKQIQAQEQEQQAAEEGSE